MAALFLGWLLLLKVELEQDGQMIRVGHLPMYLCAANQVDPLACHAGDPSHDSQVFIPEGSVQ
jgi:hypothetical protein